MTRITDDMVSAAQDVVCEAWGYVEPYAVREALEAVVPLILADALINADRMVARWAKDPETQQMAEGGARVLGSIRRRLEKEKPGGQT